MRSLRGRLIALWFMLVASAAVTAFLLVSSFRQSAAAELSRVEELVARSCREIADRYAFFTAGWGGPGGADIDDRLRQQLTSVVQAALAHNTGVEGGIWQAQAGSLAYAFPTYEGTGPKTDVPEAELGAIRRINVEAAADERPVTMRRTAHSQVLVFHACPLSGPIAGLTGWTMTRVFTGVGAAYNRLLAGLGILALTVLGSAVWLGHALLAWSHRVRRLETTLARHDARSPPRLELTGEPELDRLVTALNRAGERLAEAQQRASLNERLAATGRLAAGVAHEIRNPIAAMRLKAENALASGDAARHVAALETVLGQIARLDDLLRDLLATTQRSRPGLQSVGLGAYLAERVETFRDLAQAKGVAIDAAVSPDLGRACFDPEQIRRALDNLILNAIQNAPAGGRVHVSASRDRDALRLRVADNGPGVPEALRARLFEPFVTGRADGTGLGLAIAREIARNHGGDIHLLGSSEGASFELELPWRPRPEPS